jgi:hypothetical protein
MEYTRECPECFKEIKYKELKSMNMAIKKNSPCISCLRKGDRNPFHNKKHSSETIDKIKMNNKNNIDKYKSTEFRNKISKLNSGKNNPMYGKSFYDIWVEKYGKEVADEKMIEYKKKQSKLNSGEKNNMYGKPSPNGSGNGWSGWYKGLFFKSLKELSCMLTFESNNLEYESAERKKYKIPYIDWDGKSRNYYPDFFISTTNTIIECKPNHLLNSANVQCKRKYAEEFCKENGYSYEIIDPIRLKDVDIKNLYNLGLVKFTDRYELKYQEKFKDLIKK